LKPYCVCVKAVIVIVQILLRKISVSDILPWSKLTEAAMTRIRSPGYPSISLSEAIELTSKIFASNRHNTTDREAAVKDMGYSGVTGQSAKMLADLAHFGLVQRSGKGGISVTDVAARILHPHNPQEKRQALLEAAYSPELFSEIRANWPDGFVSENSLKAYLMRKGFATAAVQPAIKAYLDTYGFLQQEDATESHRFEGRTDRESPDVGGSKEPGASEPPSQARVASQEARATPNPGVQLMSGERVVFVEEGGPSQYLKLVACGELDATMLEALEDYVKRQKKRLPQTAASKTPEPDSP
jgi:hypothetical protein